MSRAWKAPWLADAGWTCEQGQCRHTSGARVYWDGHWWRAALGDGVPLADSRGRPKRWRTRWTALDAAAAALTQQEAP